MSDTQKTKYILVAEDDKFYANIYKKKLTKEGYEVGIASNGNEALKLAREKLPDLILLDLVMPEKDGFDTLKEIKEDAELKDVAVLVLSNLGQDEDVEKAKRLGAADYLVKTNLSIQEMMDRVSQFLK